MNEKFPSPKFPEALTTYRDLIFSNVTGMIEDEFETTGNSWAHCFGSMLAGVRLFMGSREVEDFLTQKNSLANVDQEIQDMTQEMMLLAKKYHDKLEPPEEIRNELISRFEKLKNYFD